MRLERYLEQQGESQAAFARRAGLAQSTVNEICQGKGSTVDTAVKIIKATGGLVAIEDLLRQPPAKGEGVNAA